MSSSSSTRGMIFLEPGSKIINEAISTRLADGARRPLEPVDIRLADFDNVMYRLSVDADDRDNIGLSISMGCLNDLKPVGAQVMLDELYAGMAQPSAEEGFDLTLKFNPDNLNCSAEEMIKKCSQLKRNLLGSPLDQCFDALCNNRAGSMSPIEIKWRPMESMFILPQADRCTIIFSVDFADQTDNALARVFLQEFADAQRSVSGSPPVSFSREPPLELRETSFITREVPSLVGYLTLSIFDSHVNSPEKRENAVNMIVGFRNYVHYHIKACKSYLHTRMRRRVESLLQVLNRARPDRKEATGTKTASGKTFRRAGAAKR